MSTNLHTLLEQSLPLNLELRLYFTVGKAKAACELANTVYVYIYCGLCSVLCTVTTHINVTPLQKLRPISATKFESSDQHFCSASTVC